MVIADGLRACDRETAADDFGNAGSRPLVELDFRQAGLSDAIALGAKVGLFQWVCAGLILAASRLPTSALDATE